MRCKECFIMRDEELLFNPLNTPLTLCSLYIYYLGKRCMRVKKVGKYIT